MDLSKIKLEIKVVVAIVSFVVTLAVNHVRSEYMVERRNLELETKLVEKINKLEKEQKDVNYQFKIDLKEVVNQQNIDRMIISNVQNKQNERIN